MEPAQIEEMLRGFHQEAQRACQSACDHAYSMSDAEAAYRLGLQKVCRSQPLMCWYHMKGILFHHMLKRGR